MDLFPDRKMDTGEKDVMDVAQEGETFFDRDTGEALEVVDKGEDVSILGSNASGVGIEMEGVDTGGRRRFTPDEFASRLKRE